MLDYDYMLPLIESKYEELTESEKIIADYFLNTEDEDLSSKTVSSKLYVSESALTRFAKRLGLSGYREFIYFLNRNRDNQADSIVYRKSPVFDTYEEILKKTYNLYDEVKCKTLTQYILNSKRIYIYGVGSSGYLAEEFAHRLIRLGLDAEAVINTHEILLNQVRIKADDFIMGISYSGKSIEVIEALKSGAEKKAKTALLVANYSEILDEYFDIIILLAHKQNLEYSNIISPQFPAMILLDTLFKDLYDKRQESGEVYMESVNKMLSIVKEKDSELWR